MISPLINHANYKYINHYHQGNLGAPFPDRGVADKATPCLLGEISGYLTSLLSITPCLPSSSLT